MHLLGLMLAFFLSYQLDSINLIVTTSLDLQPVGIVWYSLWVVRLVVSNLVTRKFDYGIRISLDLLPLKLHQFGRH